MSQTIRLVAASCRAARLSRQPAALSSGLQNPALPHLAGGLGEAHFGRQQQRQQQQRTVTASAAASAGGRRDARGDRYSGLTSQQAGTAAGSGQASQPQYTSGNSSSSMSSSDHASPPRNELPVFESRLLLMNLLPVQQFQAVGVSFDGRQELIPQLRKEQAVGLVREPSNPYDPNAVAIRTLDGRSLGYIARDLTQHFLQEQCFGAVGSAGQQSEEGLWGFSVVVQPTLPPVEVLALPASLQQPAASLAALLAPDARWQRMQRSALTAARGRCELTGAAVGVGVQERWQVDEELRVLRLAGLRAEAAEVTQIGRLLQLDDASADQSSALLQQLNCWLPQDAELYLQHMRELYQQRRSGGSGGELWRLDLSLLLRQGIPVPAALQPLCM